MSKPYKEVNKKPTPSSMNLPQNLEWDGGVRRVSSFRFSVSGSPGRVPSYSELDARLAWHPREGLELSVAGQNLLHAHHLEYVISGSSLAPTIGMHPEFGPAKRSLFW